MTKARDLANLIGAGNPLADGAISVAEISDLTATAAELNNVAGINTSVQAQLDSKASSTASMALAQRQHLMLAQVQTKSFNLTDRDSYPH
jgi:hypothetical protein